MKRFLTLFLVLFLSLSLTACSKAKGGEESAEKTENSFDSPVRLTEEYKNSKVYYDSNLFYLRLLGGYCSDITDSIYSILKNSPAYAAYTEYEKSAFEDRINENKAAFGDDYKYEYKIIGKESLSDADLKEHENTLKALAEEYGNDFLARFEDISEEKLNAYSNTLGIGVSDLRRLISYIEQLQQRLLSARVSEGYTLRLEITLSGSELKEPKVETEDYTVVKVDGCWMPAHLLSHIGNFEI